MSLDAMQILSNRLRHSNHAPLRFFWLRLYERIAEQSQMLDGPVEPGPMPYDSLLTMSPVNVPAIPPAAPWSERAREVVSLISAFRYAQAETKVRNILRDFPDQAWPLLQLLEVQMVLVDHAGAAATARKLSGLRELDELTRDYYMAMTYELEVPRTSIAPVGLTRLLEVESDDSVREALGKLDFVELWADENSKHVAAAFAQSIQDEVPAKTIYNIFVPAREGADAPSVSLGNVVLFGKQTDKPSRVLLMLMPYPSAQTYLDQVITALQPKSELVDPAAPRFMHYVDLITRPTFRSINGAKVRVDAKENAAAFVENFLSLPLVALDNLTPLQAAEQEPKRAALRGVLTHLESCTNRRISREAIPVIYERLQITWPETDIDLIDKSEASSLLQLLRCNFKKATDDQLAKLMLTGVQLRIAPLASGASFELLARPQTPELDRYRPTALRMQSLDTEDPELELKYLEELEGYYVSANQSVGESIMRRFEILAGLQRQDEAEALLMRAFQAYPGDPVLLNVMQQIRSSSRAGTLDEGQMLNRMVTRRAESESSESGLVLPGQAPGEPAKSKLWLPGS